MSPLTSSHDAVASESSEIADQQVRSSNRMIVRLYKPYGQAFGVYWSDIAVANGLQTHGRGFSFEMLAEARTHPRDAQEPYRRDLPWMEHVVHLEDERIPAALASAPYIDALNDAAVPAGLDLFVLPDSPYSPATIGCLFVRPGTLVTWEEEPLTPVPGGSVFRNPV